MVDFSKKFLYISSFNLFCQGKLYIFNKHNMDYILFIKCEDLPSQITRRKIKNKITFSCIEVILLLEDMLYIIPEEFKCLELYYFNNNSLRI